MRTTKTRLRSRLKKKWVIKTSETFCVLAFLGLVLTPSVCLAGKLQISLGYFNVKYAVNSTGGSVSQVGAYRFSYAPQLSPQWELEVAYTLLLSSIIGGDRAFGVDLGAIWFPLNPGAAIEAKTGETRMVVQEIWRPFAKLFFSQRQFQSAQSSYAGFGLGLGTERSLTDRLSAVGELRHIEMTGTSTSNAKETDLLIGVSLQF